MGLIAGGWETDSGVLDSFYNFPAPFIGHGCMLEAIVLAMEQRYEPFSHGRGNITPARVDEVWTMAARHGVGLAPLFNHHGLWAEQHAGAVDA
jgi:fatty aldehyde-generating acyl-ACP reductase